MRNVRQLALVWATIFAAACGGGGDGTVAVGPTGAAESAELASPAPGSPGDRAVAAGSATEMETTPAVEDPGVKAAVEGVPPEAEDDEPSAQRRPPAERSVKPDQKPPVPAGDPQPPDHPAGTFHFRQRGEEQFALGVAEGRRDLPNEATIEVSARQENVHVHVKYSDERIDDLELRRRRDGEVLLEVAESEIRYLDADHGSRFVPEPAVVFLPKDRSRGAVFRGAFGGSVNGKYTGRVLGSRTIKTSSGRRTCLESELDLRFLSGEYTGRHTSRRCWDVESGEIIWQRVESQVTKDNATYRQTAELTAR